MPRRTTVPFLLVAITSCSPIGSRPPGASDVRQSATLADIHHMTSDHLDSLTLLPLDASRPAQLLGDRGAYSYLLIRRASAGEVEVHAAWDDVFVVRTGSAALLTGWIAEGGRDTGPGERRGGHIPQPQRRALRPGDVVVIPAGLAHQVIPEAAEAVSYLVVKVPARAR